MNRRPPRSTLFPYTALFGSGPVQVPTVTPIPTPQLPNLPVPTPTAPNLPVPTPNAGDPTNPQTPDNPVTGGGGGIDRKSTRLNSSHANISYAVFCLKKKTNT